VKLLYKPMSLIVGLLSARAGKAAFKSLWSLIDERDPPKPTAAGATLQQVVLASVLEAGTMAAAGAVGERAAAQTFNYLFGVWPGEQQPRD
jgi:Protein of unknown function (DUF4235)